MGDPPYVGGIENVVDTLLHSELRDSFEFSIFDTHRTADPKRTRLEKMAYAGRLFLESRARLREVRPELVHIHFCSRADFWKHAICLRQSRSFGAQTVFHLHGGSFDQFYADMNPLEKLLVRRVYGLADRVIALSNVWKDFLSQLVSPSKIQVLNNPIDCDRLSPGPREPDPRNPTLLLLGSVGKRKGHYDVLKALPLIVKRHPSVKVLFAGSDEDEGATDELERIAADNALSQHVSFLGPVSFDPKVELLRTCTILILPSYGENMPISVLEAMAARVPVVATRVGAVPEVLAEGEAGRLIEAGDWVALAESINALLDNPSVAARLGELAGQRARDLWDVKRIAKRVDDLYRELLIPNRA
jgi:glycosyltransferase involved in cell wall biosynthesis